MTKRILTLLLLAVVVFMGCSKDEDANPVITEGDYFPLTTGTTWTYGGDFGTSTATVTGNTKEIDGQTYIEVEGNPTSGITSKAYYRKQNGEYHTVGFIGGTHEDLALTILKTNEEIGVEWYSEFTLDGFTSKYTFSIEAKGINHTVLEQEYEDVIKVHLVGSAVLFGQEVPITEEDIYFAKDIGVIQTVITGMAEGSHDLESYEIK